VTRSRSIASAIWGFRTANRCASYQTEYAARLGANELTASHDYMQLFPPGSSQASAHDGETTE
jgi:hypothetical protein